MNKRKFVKSTILVILLSLSCSFFSPRKGIEPQFEVTAEVESEKGGRISLTDGALVVIPPGSLPVDSPVSIRRIGDYEREDELGVISLVGNVYEVNLGEGSLQKSILIEIPYNLDRMPDDVVEDELFLSFFDEVEKEWIFAGGVVDKTRHVVVIETNHASIWGIFSWNWGAWIAALSKTLKVSVVEWMEVVSLLKEECPQFGSVVKVRPIKMQNVVQGCIVIDDPLTPRLRVVNPKSFYFEIWPVSGGNGYPNPTMLAPGEKIEFVANIEDPSPLVVAAEITQEAGYRLIIDLAISLLPGLNKLGNQPELVACITERLGDVSYFIAASKFLLEGNGAKAAESLGNFYLNKDAVRRFMTSADDCGYGPSRTWGLANIALMAKLTGVIIQEVDYIANYVFNYYSELAFDWTQSLPTHTLTPIATRTQTETLTPTQYLTPTSTDTPTEPPTPTNTITPTNSFPTIKVIKQANCRYGPGSAYLYAYGLYPGDQAIVLGRNYSGNWIFINPVNTNIGLTQDAFERWVI